jgi:hypothetical protein
MDEPLDPNGASPEGRGLFLAEPVLARSPATTPARRPRPAPRLEVGAASDVAPAASAVVPAPVVRPAPVAPPTPAEYFAAEEARVATAQQTFDPTRAVKGPTVVVAKRRRRRRGPVVLGVAAVAAGAALGAFTFLGGDDRSTTPVEPVSEASAEPRADQAVGRFGTLGDLEVRVVGVTDPFAYSLGPAPEGFRYVAVDVELAYGGNGVVDVPASDALAVVDGQGRRWRLAEAPFEGLGDPLPVLGPGVEASATPVFVVGDGASGLALVVTLPAEGGELVLPLG